MGVLLKGPLSPPSIPRSPSMQSLNPKNPKARTRWYTILAMVVLMAFASNLISGSVTDNAIDTIKASQIYRKYVHQVDLTGLELALMRSREHVQSHSSHSKVAFLFMEADGHAQDKIWKSFFDQADKNKYNLYVHRKSPTSRGRFLQNYPSYHEVSMTSSSWCALMGLQYAMLQASLRDPTNQQFVFLSHNAVPLKPFNYMYEDLIVESADKSKFCFTSIAGLISSDCRFQDNHRTDRPDTLKHHQWIILSRDHAEIVLYENGKSALKKYDNMRDIVDGVFQDPKMCSDETVPSMALIQKAEEQGLIANTSDYRDVFSGLEKIGVEQRCTTFAYWGGCLVNTTFDLGAEFEENKENLGAAHPMSLRGAPGFFVKDLVAHPSLLFARKFNSDAFVNITSPGDSEGKFIYTTELLRDVLPDLLDKVPSFQVKTLEENQLARLNTISTNSSLFMKST
ncbi:hypothetical protein SARC_12685 [Sphaeroforma arctica JP610]|uniref:Uncharacterized protein n=1 Tax=Sphaeroforma arctica JP610 TaxID=667725 RepID=A0A0L0FE73_9EUKA|nr:hypothetical protein SARC_12685 [Sphaeroforma arctica JP610]KNC74776.1 hypothetical protein SARC_12685 [Sphaeroforma arctica JP610]|eukprot:XP_014148678.1 hypothetical protein SARC_12685 [Sphaeroforma arctica JP610]